MTRLLTALVFSLGLVTSWASPGATQSTESADSDPRVHLINGIPDTTVDVEIDGTAAIENFAFRDTEDLSEYAGTELTGVVFTTTDGEELLDAGDVAIPDSGSVSVLLHLKVDGSPGLAIFENDLSSLEPGESRLVIRHLAAAPPVDVLAAGNVVFEGLSNGNEEAADIDAGDVTAELVPSGEDGPTVIGPADLSLLEGAALIVYGLGSFDEGTMTVITEVIEGLDTAPSSVDTGNSPVESATEPTSGPLLAVMVAVGLAGIGLLGARTGRARRSEA